jgi:hypothetical protein
MGTATEGNVPPVDSAGQLNSLLALINGGGGKSSTSTTSSNISSEGMNALLQQILGGTQGLAAVSSGQKSAGMYNSTTNQQLTNDLITQAAAKVAAQQAGTTTTTTKSEGSSGKSSQLIQGAALLKSFANTSIGKKAISSIGELISPSSAVAADGSVVSGSQLSTTLQTANAAEDPLGSFISQLGYDAPASATTAATTGEAATTTTAATGEVAEGVGTGVASEAAGATASGTAGVAAGATAEAAIGTEAVGVTAAESAAGEELFAAALAAWVICTELKSTGKLPEELYKEGAKHIAKLSEETIRGYHLWAIPYTRLMRSSSLLGKLAVAWITPWAVGRTKHLAGNKNILGWLTVYVGEPGCYVLGKLFHKVQDWRTLYA